MDAIAINKSHSPAAPQPDTLTPCPRLSLPVGDKLIPASPPRVPRRALAPCPLPPSQRKRGSKRRSTGARGCLHPSPTLTLAWPRSEQPLQTHTCALYPPTTTTACTAPKLMNTTRACPGPQSFPAPWPKGLAGEPVTHLPDGEQAPSSSFPGVFRFLRGMLGPLAQAADLRDRRGLRCLLAGSPLARQLPGPRLPFVP